MKSILIITKFICNENKNYTCYYVGMQHNYLIDIFFKLQLIDIDLENLILYC